MQLTLLPLFCKEHFVAPLDVWEVFMLQKCLHTYFLMPAAFTGGSCLSCPLLTLLTPTLVCLTLAQLANAHIWKFTLPHIFSTHTSENWNSGLWQLFYIFHKNFVPIFSQFVFNHLTHFMGLVLGVFGWNLYGIEKKKFKTSVYAAPSKLFAICTLKASFAGFQWKSPYIFSIWINIFFLF